MSAGAMRADCCAIAPYEGNRPAIAPTTVRKTLRIFIFTPAGGPRALHRFGAASATLECGRGIYPEHQGLRSPRIFPAMRRGTLEIQAVAGLQPVVLGFAQPDLEFTAQNVQKFLALVGVRFAAPPAGLYSEEMRLHRRVAPCQKFHPYARRSFQHLALR